MKFNLKGPGLACIIFLFGITTLYSQKEGGIYYFSFNIAEALVSEVKVERKDRKVLSGWSVMEDFPEEICEEIRTLTEETLSSKLNAEVECIYNKTKKGKLITSNSMGGMDQVRLEGMPFVNFKQAQAQHSKDLYLFINVEVKDGGVAKIDWGNGRSKVKPMITLDVKAYNASKDVVWKKSVKLKDFGKLRQQVEENDRVKLRKSETLGAEDIYYMYEMALEALVKA